MIKCASIEQTGVKMRVFSDILNYTNKIISAGLGAVLLPIGNLYRLASSAFAVSLIVTIAIPVFAFLAASSLQPSLGWLGASAVGIITAAGLTGLALGVLPAAYLISGLYTLAKSPFEGAKIGWDEGFWAMLKSVFSGPPRQATGLNGLLPFGEGLTYEQILEQLGEQAVNASRNPLTEEEFARLQMPADELRLLKGAQQSALTSEEIERLESLNDATINRLLERYKDLNQLGSTNCCISFDIPDREDAVLLVKQYQKDGQWLPVPGLTTVFDTTYIKTHFVGNDTTRGNRIHPLTRDNVLTPSLYEEGGREYPTRYRMHPLYLEESGPCVSQELNLVTANLRERLQPKPELGRTIGHGTRPGPDVRFPGLGFQLGGTK